MARYFDASTDDYITTGITTELDGATNATMAFWAKKSATNKAIYLSRGVGLTGDFEMELFTDGNIYAIASNGSTSYGVLSFNDLLWHHWVLVFDGSGGDNAARLKLYKDGVLQTFDSFTGTIPAALISDASEFKIGRGYAASLESDGDIGEVLIYDVSLTAGEAMNLYVGQLTRIESALGYYPLGWGSPEPDYSGNGNNGTVNGSPTISDHAPIGPMFRCDEYAEYLAQISGTNIPKIINYIRQRRAA